MTSDEIIEALRTDDDYRDGWRATIACAIMDTRREPGESLHGWRNRCAETFLNRLCGQPEGLEDLPGMMGIAASVEPYKP